MPREKVKFKYRCGEPACGNVVRSDKWTTHCRQKHAFKFQRCGMNYFSPKHLLSDFPDPTPTDI